MSWYQGWGVCGQIVGFDHVSVYFLVDAFHAIGCASVCMHCGDLQVTFCYGYVHVCAISH